MNVFVISVTVAKQVAITVLLHETEAIVPSLERIISFDWNNRSSNNKAHVK